MSKRMKKILIVCGIGIFIFLVSTYVYLFFPWVILPTKSLPNTLILVQNGYPDINRITMEHYVNDVLLNDYVLDLKTGLSYQPQKYLLPKVKEGKVKINVELENGLVSGDNSTLTINYHVSDLYNKGLLIYVTTDWQFATSINGCAYYNQYVDFVSGKKRTSYFEKAGDSEWLLTTDAPKLKRFRHIGIDYFRDYRWKENGWDSQEQGGS